MPLSSDFRREIKSSSESLRTFGTRADSCHLGRNFKVIDSDSDSDTISSSAQLMNAVHTKFNGILASNNISPRERKIYTTFLVDIQKTINSTEEKTPLKNVALAVSTQFQSLHSALAEPDNQSYLKSMSNESLIAAGASSILDSREITGVLTADNPLLTEFIGGDTPDNAILAFRDILSQANSPSSKSLANKLQKTLTLANNGEMLNQTNEKVTELILNALKETEGMNVGDDLVLIVAPSTHFMLMQITRDDADSYKITIHNSGMGNDYHKKKEIGQKEKALTYHEIGRVNSKNLNITLKNLLCLSFVSGDRPGLDELANNLKLNEAVHELAKKDNNTLNRIKMIYDLPLSMAEPISGQERMDFDVLYRTPQRSANCTQEGLDSLHFHETVLSSLGDIDTSAPNPKAEVLKKMTQGKDQYKKEHLLKKLLYLEEIHKRYSSKKLSLHSFLADKSILHVSDKREYKPFKDYSKDIQDEIGSKKLKLFLESTYEDVHRYFEKHKTKLSSSDQKKYSEVLFNMKNEIETLKGAEEVDDFF
ncbi:MAG: hypothetical protein ACI9S8_002890 [Chlamydiales bacterium]|jgi:hypothetical protein